MSPQTYDNSTRRRRKGGNQGPSSQPVEAAPREEDFTQPPSYSSLGHVWKVTQGTIPTGLAWEVANLDTAKERIERAARLLARDVDVSPRWLFGKNDLDGYDDPIHDGKMRSSTLRRITDDYAPQILAGMLRNITAGTSDKEAARQASTKKEGRHGAKLVSPIDPVAVAKHARALDRLLRDDLDASTVLGVAAQITRLGVNPKTFEQNLLHVTEWAEQNIDWQQQVMIAMRAAQSKKKFTSNLDVVQYLLPPTVKGEVEAARKQEEVTQAGRENAVYPVTDEGVSALDPLGEERQTLGHARLMAVTAGQADFFKEAQALEDQVVAERTAFDRSWLGRRLNDAGTGMEELGKATGKGLVELGTAIVTPAVYAAAALPGGKDYSDAWDFLQRNRHMAYQRLNAGQTVGDIFQEGFGTPRWTAFAFDFVAGWVTDPTVILGKGLRVARAFRTAPELLTKFGKVNPKSLDMKIFGLSAEGIPEQAIVGFSKSRQAKALYADLYKSSTSFSRRIDGLRVNTEARSALEHEYMKALSAKTLEAFPTPSRAGFEAFADGLKAHFGLGGFDPDSVAAAAVRMRTEGAAAGAARMRAIEVTEGTGDAVALADEIIESGSAGLLHPLRLEVPRYSSTSSLDPRRLVPTKGPRKLLGALVTSKAVTSTALGRRAARLPSINPGRILNYADEADVYTALHARRWRVFNESEVRTYQSKVNEALNVGPGFENRIDNLIEEVNTEGLRRIMAPYKIADEAAEQLSKDILDPIREANLRNRAFGTIEGRGLRDVVFESQRANTLFVIDPVHAENLVQRFVSTPRRLRAGLQRSAERLGLGTQKEITEALGRWHDELLGGGEALAEFGRAYRRYFKGLTVARLGYVPRVILFDENLRFLTSLSMTERLLAQKTIGLAAEKLGIGRLATRSFQYGDEVIDAPLPWRYAKEPLASNSIRAADAADELARDSKLFFQSQKAEGWGTIKATAATKKVHLRSWDRALLRDIGNSVPGRLALESVAEGKSLEQTRELLEAWATKAENVPLRQRGIGITDDGVAEWASDAAGLAHAYTMYGTKYQKEIARAILDGADDLTPLLARVPLAERPAVHGPLISNTFTGAGLTPKKLVDGLYSLFVRIPEDVLNRQPFYRAWKTRAERAYMASLKRAIDNDPRLQRLVRDGIEVKDGAKTVNKPFTSEMRRIADLASRDFALAQVKQTMFDFTKQSRFTELLQFVAPFPQPFFEGFQAWGHLVVQHPELIGRARALFDLGADTGFLKKDPDTGDWTVPMGAWTWLARKQGVIPERLKESIAFTSSLQSFNMLTSSVITLPGEAQIGAAGRIIGGVPIPTPGMDPAWQWLGQRLFKDTTNRTLTGWLFAYGPSANFVPRQVQVAINKLMPESMNEEQVKSYADEVLKEYQRLGLDVDSKGKPVPAETLAKWAMEDARDLMWARNWASLQSPASLNVRFDHDDIEEQYNQILEKAGPDAAQEWLSKNHPDLSLIGLSKTYYNKRYRDPRTGETISAPKIPSSQFFAEMVAQPPFKGFAAKYPEWLAILLVGLDSGVVYDFDPATRSRQVAQGLLKTKGPAEYWGQGENVKVWEEIDDFYKSVWNPGTARVENQGLDTQDVSYQRLILARQAFFSDLYTRYPSWVRHHLDPKYNDKGSEVTGWDWPQDAPETPSEIVMKDARKIASLKGFENFPGIVALRSYLEGRDEIAADMREAGVSSIDSTADAAAGFARRYNQLKRDVIAAVPEEYTTVMESFIEGYFRGDLTTLESNQRNALRDLPPELLKSVDRFDIKYEKLRDAAYRDYDFKWQRSDAYQKSRVYLDEQLRSNPEVVEAWWKQDMNHQEREAYKENLVGLPTVFWSRWDWKVMGVKLSDTAADALNEIGAARVEIARREEADPVGFSEGDAYDAIDRAVRDFRGKDKTFDAAIRHMNDWAFPIEKAGLAKQPGKVGKAWKAVLEGLRTAQEFVDKRALSGVDFGTDEERRLYDSLQDQFLDWIKGWHEDSPGFRQQWYDIQADIGDPLIGGLFIPDNYFGAVGKV